MLTQKTDDEAVSISEMEGKRSDQLLVEPRTIE